MQPRLCLKVAALPCPCCMCTVACSHVSLPRQLAEHFHQLLKFTVSWFHLSEKLPLTARAKAFVACQLIILAGRTTGATPAPSRMANAPAAAAAAATRRRRRHPAIAAAAAAATPAAAAAPTASKGWLPSPLDCSSRTPCWCRGVRG